MISSIFSSVKMFFFFHFQPPGFALSSFQRGDATKADFFQNHLYNKCEQVTNDKRMVTKEVDWKNIFQLTDLAFVKNDYTVETQC